jgi:hypothetical protein
MLKNYFAIRIFVMLDIAGITLYAIALVNGWPLLHVLVLPSAIIWGALSVPLAGLFVFSVYHRLMLLQRKHTHVQYMYEQQQEILLQQQRQGLLSPSPKMQHHHKLCLKRMTCPSSLKAASQCLVVSHCPRVSRVGQQQHLMILM